MNPPWWRKFLKGNTLQRDFQEIRSLTVRYVKEETLQPLKDTWRFALYGALGSLFVGFGVMLLLFAVLRLLQERVEVFRGSLSWIPYLVVAALGVLIAAFTVWRIVSGTAKRRLRATK